MPSFLLESTVSGPGIRADMSADSNAYTIVGFFTCQLSTDSVAIFGIADQQRVTVLGNVVSLNSAAVDLRGAGGSVTIGTAGTVSSNSTGVAAVRMLSDASRVNNAGWISGGTGVALEGSGNIFNSGTISGTGTAYNNDVEAPAGNTLSSPTPGVMQIANTGLIEGAYQAFSALYADQRFAIWETRGHANTITIENAGRLSGNVDLQRGAATLRNTGTILGTVRLGEGADFMSNGGTISEDVNFGSGVDSDRLENTGAILGTVSMGDGGDIVVVGGTIAGALFMDAGADILALTGTVGTGVFLGDGADAVTVSGEGNSFEIVGDAGNDTVYGGAFRDQLVGGADADYLLGNDNDDSLFGGAGADTMGGGGVQ